MRSASRRFCTTSTNAARKWSLWKLPMWMFRKEFSGTVIQKLSERKGELQGMSTASDGSVRLEFHIPSRGLIGFRNDFLTSTKGTGILNTMFDGYSPYKGDFQYRKQGSLIAFEAGRGRHLRSVLRSGARHSFHRPRRKSLQRYGHRPKTERPRILS